MIKTFHVRYYEQLQVQYLEMVLMCAHASATGLLALHQPFSVWGDSDGYAGFVPSHRYFRSFYDSLIEKHASEIDQHMAMLPARILCIDHSFKIVKHLGKVSGKPIFGALHTAVNEHGECRAMTLTVNKSHDQCMPALAAIPKSLQRYGHGDTELVFTDNVRGDKAELERIFPSLTQGVTPVHSGSLPVLTLPADWGIYMLETTWQVNTRLDALLDEIQQKSGGKFVVAMDMEWPVDKATGVQGLVSLLSVAFQHCVYLIPLSKYIVDQYLKLPHTLLVLLRSPHVL
jgi:hypothetical protein